MKEGAIKKSKNRRRVRNKQQPRIPTVEEKKKPRRMPRPFYAGEDALDYRVPGSFESNQR